MKVVTFGEVLLRFSKRDDYRLTQGAQMEAHFGGSEANAAVSLAMLGNEVRYVSRLPETAMGKACEQRLREMGLNTAINLLFLLPVVGLAVWMGWA